MPILPAPIRDISTLLSTLTPALHDGVYVFCTVPHDTDIAALALKPIATFYEAEGVTLVLAESAAGSAGLTPLFRAAWITLTVQSDLHAVGLTAAVAGALARAGISCNVIAAAFHDHIFVPVEDAQTAMAVLAKLQNEAIFAG